MIVLVGGMYRSGSTYSFNVVREILQARGKVYHEPGDDLQAALRRAGNVDHVILKTHRYDAFASDLARVGAVRVICTVRRIDDAMASLIETFQRTEEETIQAMREWLALFRAMRSQSLIVPYHDIDRHPARAAWRIGQHLVPPMNPIEAWRIARRFSKRRVKAFADGLQRTQAGVIDAGSTWYDTTTYLHRRHVSSLESRQAADRLSPELLKRMHDALASDLIAAGLGSGSRAP